MVHYVFRRLEGYNEQYCRGGNHGYDNLYKSMRVSITECIH